jgi:hypothetical protein
MNGFKRKFSLSPTIQCDAVWRSKTTNALFELREMLFGRRPNVFRTLFTIDGDAVRVLRVRRATRRSLSRRELREADE